MIEFRPTPPGQVRAAHNRVAHLLQEEASEPKNLDAFTDLFGSAYLPFDGQVYEVPPLPVKLGAEMLKLELRLRRLPETLTKPEHIDENLEIGEAAKALFPKAVRIVGWRRYISWAMPNPFRNMGEREVGMALAFFSMCRTRSRVPYPPGAGRRGQ